MTRPNNILLLILLSTFVPPVAYAEQEAADPYKDTMLSDWGGARTALAAQGIDATVEYKGDVWNVASGGIKTGSNYDDNLDVKFALDGQKIAGLVGNTAVVYFLNNAGSHPNASRVGSLQGIDNIEVVKDTPRLYEAWDEQRFWNGKFSVLVGLRDLNAEFDETDGTANFLRPNLQINAELGQAGQNGPSIFPTTSLAYRVKILPTDDTYLLAGIFDGVSGDPNHQYGNHFKFNGGALLIAEAGWAPGFAPGAEGDAVLNKVGVGAWEYTQEFHDLNSGDTVGNNKHLSNGVYLLSSYQCYADKEHGKSVVWFFRPGIADGNTKPIDFSYVTGVVGYGWVPSRPDAEIGVAFTQSRNSDKYLEVSAAGGNAVPRNEYGVESYYRDKLYPGLYIEPDVQFIANPSMTANAKNAWVLGFRTDIIF